MKTYLKTIFAYGLIILGACTFVVTPTFAASSPSHAPRHQMTVLPNFKDSRTLAETSPAGKHVFGIVSSLSTDSITVAVNTGHGTSSSSTSDVVTVDTKTVYGGSISQTGFSGIKIGDHVVVMMTNTSPVTAREVSVIDTSAFANQVRNALSKSNRGLSSLMKKK